MHLSTSWVHGLIDLDRTDVMAHTMGTCSVGVNERGTEGVKARKGRRKELSDYSISSGSITVSHKMEASIAKGHNQRAPHS